MAARRSTFTIIDHVYDVVVVGAGGAGLRAAMGVGTAAAPAWSVLFLPEVDAFHDDRPPCTCHC